MRVTIEFNEDESHLAKWCLLKCAEVLGTGRDMEMKYQHKISVSNIYDYGPLLINFGKILKINDEMKKK